MKVVVSALVVSFLSVACTTASPPPHSLASTAPRQVEMQVRSASSAWNEAIVAKDMEALRTFMAPEFTLTVDDARNPLPLEQWLQNLPNMTFHRYATRILDVRTYGQLAVASVEGEWDITFMGRRVNEPFLLADFWVQRDGRWQVYRRHRIR